MGCKVIKLNNGISAIVCGTKRYIHNCNDRMVVLLLSDGSRVPANAANQFKYENDVFTTIVGASVACDICGEAMIDKAWKLGD